MSTMSSDSFIYTPGRTCTLSSSKMVDLIKVLFVLYSSKEVYLKRKKHVSEFRKIGRLKGEVFENSLKREHSMLKKRICLPFLSTKTCCDPSSEFF